MKAACCAPEAPPLPGLLQVASRADWLKPTNSSTACGVSSDKAAGGCGSRLASVRLKLRWQPALFAGMTMLELGVNTISLTAVPPPGLLLAKVRLAGPKMFPQSLAMVLSPSYETIAPWSVQKVPNAEGDLQSRSKRTFFTVRAGVPLPEIGPAPTVSCTRSFWPTARLAWASSPVEQGAVEVEHWVGSNC